MRTILTILTLVALCAAAPSAAGDAPEEAEAIAAAIQGAYVEGIWTTGDEEAAREGFDPSFVMQVSRDEGTLSVTLDAWLERLGLHGEALDEGITHEIKVLDQVGSAAVARVLVYRDGKPLYTDYMSLYKRDGDWRIVAKTFHTHKE